jgi:hypothetical protein
LPNARRIAISVERIPVKVFQDDKEASRAVARRERYAAAFPAEATGAPFFPTRPGPAAFDPAGA